MITYTQTTTTEELEQILKLQKKNLFENLSEEERIAQGFVTVKHSLEVLEKMNAVCTHTIAKHNNKVIGYALSMAKDFASDIAVLKPMFMEIEKSAYNSNYITMGQICIDKEHRGLGVFRGLYQFMKTEICSSRFSSIITEIDIKNKRSLKAHKVIGFQKIKDYKSGDKIWRLVKLQV
jgi:hypothetical protein